MAQLLEKKLMLNALVCLDSKLSSPLELIIGGGGAMILAHDFKLATLDIDAIPLKKDFEAIDKYVKAVAKELNLPGDWLNPWFSSFTHTLPASFAERLIEVFSGKYILAKALGATDLLIMKCYAHREKDIGHARALIKKGADTDMARKHIEKLEMQKIPQSGEALDFLDELEDFV